jgi:class 3 adenylate cyclase
MSRLDCISNRNIIITATYVKSKLGTFRTLLEGLPYPSDEYGSPEDFFLNEDEWTTYDNFERVLRQAKELVDEPDFYFNCGASSARFGSWGRFDYFVRIFVTPHDGFKRLPFFNKNFNDTKEIDVIVPPTYDSRLKKFRTLLKIENHRDIDPHRDYIRDPYLRGILSSIPTIWGLSPASVRCIMNPYDPAVLFNEEADFLPDRLEVKLEGDLMTLRHPEHGRRCIAGEKVLLKSQIVNGESLFLGKYDKVSSGIPEGGTALREGILVTETIKNRHRLLLSAGEIFSAPYFILDVSYDRFSPLNRLSQVFRLRGNHDDSGTALIDTINQLRRSIRAKNEAYRTLEKTNLALTEAKARLDDYAGELEKKVEERTAELRKAQDDLLQLNRDLELKVTTQVAQLEKYRELRRYLSPKIAEKILAEGQAFGTESQRKMMTVVFSDIRGFSAVTDSLEPEEISHLLNRYLSEMTRIIHQYDGTLNKIVGDGLMIFFGDPIPLDDHAERGVLMAVDMQKRVEVLRDEWRHFNHDLGVGIGINTGFMTVGNIGSDDHSDYTVIGNQVNVAARLESMAASGQILVSQRTKSQIHCPIQWEEVGDIEVKGIHSPIRTYNVKVF